MIGKAALCLATALKSDILMETPSAKPPCGVNETRARNKAPHLGRVEKTTGNDIQLKFCNAAGMYPVCIALFVLKKQFCMIQTF